MTHAKEGPPSFSKPLSEPPPIPEQARAAAADVLARGRLFRYGEDTGGEDHASLLEREFAASIGRTFAVAMNSCGGTLFAALRCLDVDVDEPVLFNAFTLAPVPGAIGHARARPVPVEIGEDYTVDLDDLARKARATRARVLLLSHMRGHMAPMDRLVEACDTLGLQLIEDCAHTMGASWDGRPSGTFGTIGCFSTQTFKHLNSGEGGLFVTDDEDIAARAILLSGSYALYAQHLSRPALEVFERWRATTPNCSLRMSNLVAALLRPQLPLLEARARAWNERHAWLVDALDGNPHLWVPARDEREAYVASSLQFNLRGLDDVQTRRFLAATAARGVYVKWFGDPEPVGFTGRTEHWAYLGKHDPLPRTHAILASLCDMRIPLDLSRDDCRLIARIIGEELHLAANDART